MAVFKRGYERYEGPLTTPLARLLVLPRFAWESLLQQRIVVILFVLALFWPLLCGVFVYLSNHLDLLGGMEGNEISNMLKIDGQFFAIFMNVQSVFAMILASISGPGLIAPDLANNALPLYFARPLSRWSYIAARMLVLLGILSLVTLVPAVFLLIMQASMGGSQWLASYWWLGPGVMLGFLILLVVVSLVALACSAYVKWRVVAGALVLAFFFVLAGAATIVNAVLRVQWGSLFNPGFLMWRLWCGLLGVEPPAGPGLVACSIAVVLLIIGLVTVLLRKLRPVEVIS